MDTENETPACEGANTWHTHQHMPFDEAVISRHSTRLFLPKPIPDDVFNSALQLAAHSPSNSNTQAWRLYVVTGAALQRLKAALTGVASSGVAPNILPLPEEFRPWRSELGKAVYGDGWGIPREDTEARQKAVLHNYDFFGAPVGIIVCMSKKLPGFAAMSVGMYLQTLLLAFTDRGLGSCVQVSIAGYKDVVREQVGIADDLEILCGVSVGYEDTEANVNRVRLRRIGVGETTVFVTE
ncbi:hypothetical protein QQS21_003163 [Conoideocrella luteorostrata]|uniref:Nitroreductase domain-containing protein n=1 Tax=Conoideocrella luteorostrata TaxID=1105319 RepID=A0AAJ0G0Q9_9HYPO|nr:hypothetical protein QQS21_003163 [Conoideocrella luteorostrata]